MFSISNAHAVPEESTMAKMKFPLLERFNWTFSILVKAFYAVVADTAVRGLWRSHDFACCTIASSEEIIF